MNNLFLIKMLVYILFTASVEVNEGMLPEVKICITYKIVSI